ncbi:hypothetical protein V8E36_008998, partial [Tilletia maclaganii]
PPYHHEPRIRSATSPQYPLRHPHHHHQQQQQLQPPNPRFHSAAAVREATSKGELISGNIGPIRAKRKSKILNLDRKKICEYHRDNPGHRQDDIAALFGIERSTVSRILKDQERWLAIEDASDAAKIAKHRTGRYPALEARLDGELKAQALKFASELGLEGSFRASLGWCDKFRDK